MPVKTTRKPTASKAAKVTKTKPSNTETLQTVYGVLVVENVNSNPNGDPDNSGAPRQFEGRKTGGISRASILRKFREHVLRRTPTFLAVCESLGIEEDEIDANYNIYVENSRTAAEYSRELIEDPDTFFAKYVDARLLSQTLLESESNGRLPKAGGPLFFGMMESLQPIEVYTGTNTRAQGMSGDKKQDIAPNSIRLTRYGLYTGRFGVSPDLAEATQATAKDFELFFALLPHLYNFKAANRAGTEIVQVWTLKKPLTLPLSHAKFEAIVQPKYVGESPEEPATSRKDYQFVTEKEAKAALAKIPGSGDKITLQVVDLV